MVFHVALLTLFVIFSASDSATLSKAFVLALPVLATFFSGLLAQDKFGDRWNALIAAVIIGLAALITALLGGQLTGNAATDAGIIATAAMGLQATVLAPLHQFLKSSVFVYAPVTHQVTTKQAAVRKPPQPIQLGTSAYVPPQQSSVGDNQGG